MFLNLARYYIGILRPLVVSYLTQELLICSLVVAELNIIKISNYVNGCQPVVAARKDVMREDSWLDSRRGLVTGKSW